MVVRRVTGVYVERAFMLNLLKAKLLVQKGSRNVQNELKMFTANFFQVMVEGFQILIIGEK